MAKKSVAKTQRSKASSVPKKNSSSSKKTASKKKATSKATKKKTTTKKKIATKSTTQSSPRKEIPKLEDIVPNVEFSNVPEPKDLPQFTLPELPDIDDIKPKEEDNPFEGIEPVSDSIPEIEEEPTAIDFPKDPSESFLKPKEEKKKSFLSNLFGLKKKTESISIDKTDDEIKKGFEEDAKDYLASKDYEDHIQREKVLIENMKRRTDNDFRERMSHLTEHEKSLHEKEQELLEKDRELTQKEIDLAKKDEVFQDLQKLKEELENQNISLVYQKQQIEELKSELALKDKSLREKEIELDEREEELQKLESIRDESLYLQKENTDLHEEVEHDEDEIAELQAEIEKQRAEFEKQMQSMRLDSIAKQDSYNDPIQKLITACHIELSQGNIRAAKMLYNKIREEYQQTGKSQDANRHTYKDIVQLYQDISSMN